MADQRSGPDDDLVTLGPYTGINNIDAEDGIGPSDARASSNIDFLRSGQQRSRPGRTPILTALVDAGSLHAARGLLLMQEAGALKRIDVNERTATTLETGLNPNLPVSYAEAAGQIWWSNGEQQGRITRAGEAKSWGLPVPGRPVVTAAAGGSLSPGRYQVALAYVSADGEEGGAGGAVAVDVAADGAIDLSAIQTHPDVAEVQIYITKPGDTVLRRHSRVPAGTASATIGLKPLGDQLRSQFAAAPPPGTIVRYANGRILVARGRLVFFTLPQRYALCIMRRDYLPPFPGDIVLLEPANESGWFIGTTDATWFVVFGEEGQKVRRQVAGHGAVPGTSGQAPATAFGMEGARGNVAYWFSAKGQCIGLDGGGIQYPAKDKVSVARYESGAALYRERAGLKAIIAAMKSRGVLDPVRSSDDASITIRRNGVLV